LAKESDYVVLLDNKLEKRMFDGGYVHNGFLKSTSWLISNESKTLKDLIKKNPSYTLNFVGHSLGLGVVSMLTLVVANNRGEMGNIPRSKIKCYVVTPARCGVCSLIWMINLILKYCNNKFTIWRLS
jgi:predicted lipase